MGEAHEDRIVEAMARAICTSYSIDPDIRPFRTWDEGGETEWAVSWQAFEAQALAQFLAHNAMWSEVQRITLERASIPQVNPDAPAMVQEPSIWPPDAEQAAEASGSPLAGEEGSEK